VALTIDISIDSISSDRATATLLDATVYGTRGNFGTYVVAQKINQDTTVESTLTVTGSDADPYVDTSWTFTIPNDGWFRVSFIAAEAYVAGSYNIYEIVDDGAGNLYQANSTGSSTDPAVDTNRWTALSTDALIAAAAANANSDFLTGGGTVYEFILTPNSEYEYANAISDASEEATAADVTLENLLPYIRLGAILDGMYVDSDRASYPEGERKARRFESIVE